jgi:hypothetical protein
MNYGANPYATTDYSTDANQAAKTSGTALKTVATVSAAASTAATVAAAALAVPAYPFNLIAAAVAASVAACLAVAGAIGKRNQKLLRGDKTAIAPFLKHVAKWKSAKRTRVAARLLKEYEKHKRHQRHGKPWKVRENMLSMKLGALYAAEAHARMKPHVPLDPDGQSAAQVEAQPDTPLNSGDEGAMPIWGWGIGALLVVGGIIAVSSNNRGSHG